MTKEDIPAVDRALKREFKAHPAPIIELIEAQTKDPFKVLVGTILSARTKDACTAGAVRRLFAAGGGTPEGLEKLPEETRIIPLRQVLSGGFPEFVHKLGNADAFVIGAPLYVDGLPAQAVKLLEMLLECDKSALSGKRVYVISNLGFYESEQICNLFDIVQCFHYF